MGSEMCIRDSSETIRVGTSEYQNVNSATTVSGNYFVQADGENEIISNKSMNNIYTNNTFRRSRGSLVLRHGANAIVEGNYFLGENVEGTGGIRIADSNHQITNNYIQDCISSVEQIPWNNGMTFVGGNTNSVQNCNSTSVSNAYQDVENINFSNNTFINTHSPFYFNATRDGADDVFGDVTNNLIYFANNNDNNTDVINGSYSEIGTNLDFSGNVYNSATSVGENASGFSQESITVSASGEIFTHNQSGKGAFISEGPITDSMVGNGIGACFLGAEGNSQSDCDGTVIEIPTENDSLTVSSLSRFDADGASQSITVTSNIDWSVSENTSWITIGTSSGSNNGSINVTATANTSASASTATITVSGEDITRTVTVSQDGTEEEETTEETTECVADTPSNRNTSNISGTSATFSWSFDSEIDHYNLRLRPSGSDTWINYFSLRESEGDIDVSGSTATIVISDLTNDTTYEWQMRAKCVDGSGSAYTAGAGEDFTTTDGDDNNGGNSNGGNNNNDDNLALNGTASQSTTAFNGAASRAIDGDTNGSYNGGSVTHTASVTGSWWEVELDSQTNIGDIIIYNRTNNCCVNRLSNFTVEVYNNNGNVVYSQTITQVPNPSLTINADGVSGRTIRVTNNSANTPLSLAEVEVYAGEESNSNNSASCSAGTNLALSGDVVDFSSEQNSTNSAENVNDDNEDNRWSAANFPQDITIDLGDVYNVDEINLVPFEGRAYQFTIEGSTTSATSGFVTLTDATNNTSGGDVINESFSSQAVRYVKLTVTGASGYDGVWTSIHEFEVICGGNTSNKSINDVIATNEVVVYPNPVVSTTTIEGAVNSTIYIYDMNGSVVLIEDIVSDSEEINLSSLSTGIYYIQVEGLEGSSVTKLVKQ